MKGKKTLESLSAFAVRRGVSRTTATAWRARGLLVMEDGKVNVARSKEKLAQRPPRQGKLRGEPRAPPPVEQRDADTPHSLDEALRRRLNFAARQQQLDLDLQNGTVVPTQAVAKLASGILAPARAQLLGLGAKVVPRLILAAGDQTAILAILNAELERILAPLALSEDAARMMLARFVKEGWSPAASVAPRR